MGSFSSINPLYLVKIAPEGLTSFFSGLNQFEIIIGLILFDVLRPSLSNMELNYVGAAIAAL